MSNKSMKNERKNMLDVSAEDFEPPLIFKKSKSLKTIQKSTNEGKGKKSSKKRQVTLHQIVKQNLHYSDVNPEHLQMALALSKSISENQIDDTTDERYWKLDDNKKQNKQTLLEFGFKSSRNKMSSENKITRRVRDPVRINNKSKFRFITPILFLRTEEDRESLIQSKIAQILTNNIQENFSEQLLSLHITSEELMKINCSECSIFRLNDELNEFSSPVLSVPDLISVENRTKCGFLLRDWKSIPLRDHSPDMTKPLNTKSISKEKEIQLHTEKNSTDFKSAICDLNPCEPVVNLDSTIHENIHDCDSNICKEINTDIAFKKNMYIIPSPDLFEDQNSLILNDASVIEDSASKPRKSWKKLFVNDAASEIQNVLDDTSKNLCFRNSLEQSLKKHSSKDNILCLASETIEISSSSDEENIKNSDLYKSLVETKLNKNANTSFSYSSTKHFELIPDKVVSPVLTHNITDIDNKYILPIDDETEEYNDNKSELNFIANVNKLEENISNLSSLEANMDISNTSNGSYKIHSNHQSICLLSPTIEDDFSNSSINKNNFKYLQKDDQCKEKSCNSNAIKIDKTVIGDCLLDEKKTCDKSSSINKSYKYSNISFYNDINFTNRNNCGEDAFKSDSFNSDVLPKFHEHRKEDSVNVFQSISESYKEYTSLNVTEHIEEMLARPYSPITSINISDEEHTPSIKEEEKRKSCERISKFNSIADQQNSFQENVKTFKDNTNFKNSIKKLCSPTLDINLSDENYSNNVKTNEKHDISKDTVALNDKQILGNENRTPLRRYTSFSESSAGRKTSSFGRYKSESDVTPKNKFIIKTDNITPMMNYNTLDTPSIVKELSKYGLKPLKRKRGVNLLQHIYEATHPVVEALGENSDENNKVMKKRKNNRSEGNKSENVSQDMESRPDNFAQRCHPIEPWTETISDSDFIFERHRSSKIPCCQIPLQIVWHNFLVENPEIRENILLYEPLEVNVISSMLKEQGFKFHVQDLITFLDRKCITIKI